MNFCTNLPRSFRQRFAFPKLHREPNAGRVASGDWCQIDGRRTQVSAFPIGIDTEAFAKEARTAEKSMTVKCTLKTRRDHKSQH